MPTPRCHCRTPSCRRPGRAWQRAGLAVLRGHAAAALLAVRGLQGPARTASGWASSSAATWEHASSGCALCSSGACVSKRGARVGGLARADEPTRSPTVQEPIPRPGSSRRIPCTRFSYIYISYISHTCIPRPGPSRRIPFDPPQLYNRSQCGAQYSRYSQARRALSVLTARLQQHLHRHGRPCPRLWALSSKLKGYNPHRRSPF